MISKIGLLLHLNPAKSIFVEWTLLIARGINTSLHSNINLAILHYHKQRTENLPLINVANEFVLIESR